VRVSSVREVDWKDSRRGGFMFVFSPGVCEQAPQMFIAPMTGPKDPARRAQFQHDLVAGFPNVSVIDLREILENVRAVIRNVTLAITVVGLLVGLSGVLILIGAVAMTKFQRVYEAAIFKTLGASTRAREHARPGIPGCSGRSPADRLVGSHRAHVGRQPLGSGNPVAVLSVGQREWRRGHRGAGVAVVGVLSSLDVLRKKPLSTLRAE
jgi:putative ABC transport system permease protein